MWAIWLDECYVYIGDNQGTVWVTWAVDEEFNKNCIKFIHSKFQDLIVFSVSLRQ